MKSVAIYARVSSEQQVQQATVASQIAALKERAQADGCTVLPSDVYVDEGRSGATLVRPALEKLRDRIAEGGLEILYVHSPDRLARRYAYQVLLLEEFTRQGVSVIFLNGPTGRTAEDELLVQVQGMIAEYERAKILERSRRGKLHKARIGLINPLGGAPYGYLYVRKTEDEPARYQVLLHEAKVVRSIFQWLVEEQVSIGEITRRLAAQRIATRKGLSRWDRATVWGILRNPAYMGLAAFGKTEAVLRGQLLRPIRNKSPAPKHAKSSFREKPKEDWISIPVPPIVSPEIFAAAKEQLERNRRLSARNGRGRRYLLQGLTVCARCGYAFYGKLVSRASRKGKFPYGYYRCVGSDAYRFEGGRICQNPQVRVEQLDGYVWDSVRQVMQDPTRVLEEWTRRGAHDGTLAELNTQREEAKHILTAQEQILRRLRDAYEAGALDLDDLVARSERVRGRIRHAQEELKKAETMLAQTVELKAVVARLKDFAEHVGDGLEQLGWYQQRQLIRTLVARVEIDEGGATVVYRVPTSGGSPHGPQGSGGIDENGPTSEIAQLRGRRAQTHAARSLYYYGHSKKPRSRHTPGYPEFIDGEGEDLWEDAEQYLDYLDTAAASAESPACKRLLEFLGDARLNHGLQREPGMLKLMAAAARRLLAAECCSFIEGVDPDSERWSPYQRWLREVFVWGEDTVVTFNYDLVPEMVARSQKRQDSFQYRTKEPGCSFLLKLHGSVNWLLQSTLAVRTDADDRAALTCDDHQLAIAGPGPGKKKLSSGLFEWCWTEALAALEKASAIVFVGYRFPPTDAEARERLLGAIRKNNEQQQLAIHTVLGPDTSSDDSRRLRGLLEHAMAGVRNVRGGGGRGYSLEQQPLWAEDFFSVVVPRSITP